MKTLPMFLKTTGQRIAVIGGGEQAAQKARLALKTDAHITVYADMLNEELAEAHKAGKLDWHKGLPTVADVENSRLIFVALACPGAAAAVATLARETKAVVNTVDAPAWSDAYTPSIVDRDPIVIAIGTEGSAPMLGRRIRGHLEETLPEGLGAFAAYAGALRPRVARNLARKNRVGFWRRFFSPLMRDRFIEGDTEGVEAWVDAALKGAEAPSTPTRVTVLITPAPGDADLLSLRAARRLQETDLILHPDDCDPGLLELARRDAERMPVHSAPDGSAAPPRVLARLIVEAAEGAEDLTVLVSSRARATGICGYLADAPLEISILDAAQASQSDALSTPAGCADTAS